VGDSFRRVAYALPFVHGVEMERAALAGDLGGVFPHLWWVLGYVAVATTAAVGMFLRQMKRS
jgi:ABC-2 type transport system permease protein